MIGMGIDPIGRKQPIRFRAPNYFGKLSPRIKRGFKTPIRQAQILAPIGLIPLSPRFVRIPASRAAWARHWSNQHAYFMPCDLNRKSRPPIPNSGIDRDAVCKSSSEVSISI